LTIVWPASIYTAQSTSSRTWTLINNSELEEIWTLVPGSRADVFLIEDYIMALFTVLIIFWQVRHPWKPFNDDTSVREWGRVFRNEKGKKVVLHSIEKDHTISKK